MKKLIFLLSIITVIFSLNVNAQDYKINKNTTYFEYSGEDSDTVIADGTWGLWLANQKDFSMLHAVKVSLDSVSGTPTCDVKLQGKVFDDDSWTDITTVEWTGTTSDTTFTISETSTAKFYRHYRVYIDTDATEQKLKVDKILMKFWIKQ